MSDVTTNDLTLETLLNEAGFSFEPSLEGSPAILGGIPAFSVKQPFMRPTLPSWDKLAESVSEIITTGMVTKGHYLDAFEERVAQYLGVKHAVAVSSCTSGLMLLYQNLGLEGEVLVPSFTFMATIHPLVWQGATPIFVDIDPLTWNIDSSQIETHITPRTTAIVAVHIYGNPAAIETLEAIAQKYNLALIFDAAHGFGTLHHNAPLGSYGMAEVFSTSPTKLLVTGEGGIVTTNDENLADRIRVGREYGNPGNYDSLVPGLNARMQEFSAILGLHSLEMLEENTERRNKLASIYQTCLADIPGVSFQSIHHADRSSYKDFTIHLEATQFGLNRDALQASLASEGIDTRAYYVPPVHQHSAYKKLVQKQQPKLPVTDSVVQSVLSLPMYSHMQIDSTVKVCEAICRIHHHAHQIQDRLNRG